MANREAIKAATDVAEKDKVEKTKETAVKKKNKAKDKVSRMAILTKGFFKENPVFVFLLGMCPALAVTTYVETAVGMGMLVIFVLIGSNIVVSILKSVIPAQVKIPAYIVIIATFVTIVDLLTKAFAPALSKSLGVFIPLIVVNCVILGRAESFASKNGVVNSAIDGLGTGIGFTFAIGLIALVREVLATGTIGYGKFLPLPFEGDLLNAIGGVSISDYGIKLFGMAPGAFLALGLLLALFNHRNNIRIEKAEQLKKAEAKLKAGKA